MAIKIFAGRISAATEDNPTGRSTVAEIDCTLDGIITTAQFYSRSAGNLKWALWCGPTQTTAALCDSGTLACTGTAFNDVALTTPIPSSVGDRFYLGGNPSADGVLSRNTDPSQRYYYATPYATWTPADPMGAAYSSSTSRTDIVALYGYTPPVITSINGGADIADDDTGIVLNGTDLIDSAGYPSLYLCSTNNYATAPVKVLQSNNSGSDTVLDFDVVPGALSPGTVYAFLVSALGQVSDPVAVTLVSSGPAPVYIAGIESAGWGSVLSNYHYLMPYTVTLSAEATMIRVYSMASGNIILTIYQDAGGVPGALLYESAPIAVTGGGYNDVPIAGPDVVGGSTIWLGGVGDTSGALSRYGPVGYFGRLQIAATYSGFSAPDPASAMAPAAYDLAIALYGIPEAPNNVYLFIERADGVIMPLGHQVVLS